MNPATNNTFFSWLNCGKDTSTSPFGRQLSFVQECTRFTTIERTSTQAKLVAGAISIVAIAVLASPILCLGVPLASMIAHTLTYKTAVFPTVSLVASYIIASGIYYNLVFNGVANERGVQLEEQAIVDALGGQEEFDKLPRLSPKICDSYLGREGDIYVRVSDVSAPIVVGIDRKERPFVSMHVHSKTGIEEYVETYVSKESPLRANSWTCCSARRADQQSGPSETPDLFSVLVGQCSETIKMLKNGTHPNRQLI